jgi:hypothetical protein
MRKADTGSQAPRLTGHTHGKRYSHRSQTARRPPDRARTGCTPEVPYSPETKSLAAQDHGKA